MSQDQIQEAPCTTGHEEEDAKEKENESSVHLILDKLVSMLLSGCANHIAVDESISSSLMPLVTMPDSHLSNVGQAKSVRCLSSHSD